MSYLSGKCDLLDHLEIIDNDLNKAFEEFKKRTDGILHQYIRVEVTQYNQNFIASKCVSLEIIEHKKMIQDKRMKKGQKEITTYTYKYWEKEYNSLHQLNKKGVYIVRDIKFDTLRDLVPYLPYTVAASHSFNGKENIYLSNESYVEAQAKKSYKYGHEPYDYFYRHALGEFYKHLNEEDKYVE